MALKSRNPFSLETRTTAMTSSAENFTRNSLEDISEKSKTKNRFLAALMLYKI